MNNILTRSGIFLTVMLLVAVSCRMKPFQLVAMEDLADYPSGSAVVFLNNQLYLMGDDARYLMITEAAGFRPVDSLPLYEGGEKRVPKKIKADLEAATVIEGGGRPRILLLGSGSLDPYRSTGWLIDPAAGQKELLNLAPFYERIRQSGVPELNIEGAATVRGQLVLAARGHLGYRHNHLVVTSTQFWEEGAAAPLRLLPLLQDTAAFGGVSGLDYAPATDRLFVTVSTENTASTFGDGEIGKSYLWIIEGFSKKMQQEGGIRPDRIIDLEAADSRFKGQKIESVCLLHEDGEGTTLVLVADNDGGTTRLFRIRL